jgi:hypothetical protein
MLFRRVLEHVQAQNWLAVFIDFFIVVVGVFVGLQVNNWNESLALKRSEHAALVRLQSEAENAVQYWIEQVLYSEENNQNRRLLVEVLNKGEMSDEDSALINDAFMRLGHYPANTPPSAVYNELVGTGRLHLISDVDARDAVSRYAESLEFVNGQLTQFRTVLPTQQRAYQGRVFSTYDPDRTSLRRFTYDFSLLAADRQFKSDITDLVRDQIQFHNYRVWALEAAIKMCEEVSRALAKEMGWREPIGLKSPRRQT